MAAGWLWIHERASECAWSIHIITRIGIQYDVCIVSCTMEAPTPDCYFRLQVGSYRSEARIPSGRRISFASLCNVRRFRALSLTLQPLNMAMEQCNWENVKGAQPMKKAAKSMIWSGICARSRRGQPREWWQKTLSRRCVTTERRPAAHVDPLHPWLEKEFPSGTSRFWRPQPRNNRVQSTRNIGMAGAT